MASPVALNISAAAIALMGLSVTGLPWLPPDHCKFLLCERHVQQRETDCKVGLREMKQFYLAPKIPYLRA